VIYNPVVSFDLRCQNAILEHIISASVIYARIVLVAFKRVLPLLTSVGRTLQLT